MTTPQIDKRPAARGVAARRNLSRPRALRPGVALAAIAFYVGSLGAQETWDYRVFHHDDGSTFQEVRDLLETPDGAICIATWGGGVTRVKGANHETFDESTGLPGNWVRSLENDGAGGVWIGTADGLGLLQETTLRSFTTANTPEFPRDGIRLVRRMRDASLWVAFDGVPTVLAHRSDRSPRWAPVPGLDELPAPVHEILETSRGDVWISCQDGQLFRYAESTLRQSFRFEYYVSRLVETGRGVLWAVHAEAVLRLEQDSSIWSTVPKPWSEFSFSIAVSPDDDIIVGTREGVYVRHDDDWSRVPLQQPFNVTRTLWSANTSHRWIGTRSGVLRGTRPPFRRFTRSASGSTLLPGALAVSPSHRALCADISGTVVEFDGVEWHERCRIADPDFRPIFMLSPDGDDLWSLCDNALFRIDLTDGVVRAKIRIPPGFFSRRDPALGVRLFRTRAGEIWVLTEAGVFVLEGSSFNPYRPEGSAAGFPSARSAAQAQDGSIYVCFRNFARGSGTIERWAAGRAERLEEGFPILRGKDFESVSCGPDGAVWIGTQDVGVLVYDGESIHTISRRDGLASNLISTVWVSPRQTVWVGYRRKGIGSLGPDDRWVNHGAASGVPNWRIDRLGEDSDGRLWLSCDPIPKWLPAKNQGVFRFEPDPDPPETSIEAYPSHGVDSHGIGVFSFSARDAWGQTAGEEITYSWRVLPLEKGDGAGGRPWSPFTRGMLAVTRDPPLGAGRYRFEVRAADLMRNIDPTPAVVEFTVVRPLWMRPLFLAPVGFLSLVALLSLSFWYRKHVSLLKATRDRLRTEAEKHDLEDRLLHSQKLEAIGRLAAGVAHDFNNVLLAVIGYTELARKKSDSPEVRSYLENVESAARQATAVTRALLTFSRKTPSAKSALCLEETVAQSLRLVRRVLPASVRVVAELREDARTWILADESQIHQVVLNLMLNARDAMPDGGTLRTSVMVRPSSAGEPDGPTAELSVEDTGHGMSEEVKAHIFDPFFTTKPRGEGTGLGMAIVHGIVEDHNGTITVETAEERGTKVVISLPTCSPPERRSAEEKATPMSRADALVLVAEDRDIVERLLRSVLEAADYRVESVGDGNGAVALFERQPEAFDLVILDIDLPGQSGLACLEAMRRTRPDLPVMLISGVPTNEVPDDPRVRFLQKPFTRDDLVRGVGKLLDETRS